MIATHENPCVCGNEDYAAFWCYRCKREADVVRSDGEGFLLPPNVCVTNPQWITNFIRSQNE
jgi:hypothetical protein